MILVVICDIGLTNVNLQVMIHHLGTMNLCTNLRHAVSIAK